MFGYYSPNGFNAFTSQDLPGGSITRAGSQGVCIQMDQHLEFQRESRVKDLNVEIKKPLGDTNKSFS